MSLESLLRPRSVAIIGASQREGSFGNNLLRSVVAGGYGGRIYPVNPSVTAIDGLDCYPDLDAIGAVPACALIALGDRHVVPALERAARAGVKAAVLFGRGHGELEDGRTVLDALRSIARDASMAICGGNCMGFVNLLDRLQVTSMPFAGFGAAGHVGLVSHSGSTWSGLVGNGRDVAFNIAVSAGQELTTTVADYIRYLLSLPSTRVIACVLETVRDPEGFLAALEEADKKGVPVVILKLGRSEAAKHFAISHSGAISGANAAYDAIFARHNVIAVRTLDELMDSVEMFRTPRVPPVQSLAIGTDSGGERQMIVDLASDMGVPFARLTSETEEQLRHYLDPGVEPANPLDYWGDGGNVIDKCLRVLSQDAHTGLVVMASNLVAGRPFATECADAALEASGRTDKPTAVLANVGGTPSPVEVRRLREAGLPVLSGTETGLKAMWSFLSYHHRKRRIAGAAVPPPVRSLTEWCERMRDPDAGLTAAEGFDLLREAGIPTAPWASVGSAADVIGFARCHGYPVVLKIDDPKIPHKSEHGGVVVGIRDDVAAESAWQRLRGRHPAADILVQKQETGQELLVGMNRDAQFGPIVTLGLGGVFVEVLRDVVHLSPPYDAEDVLDALARLRSIAMLKGYRGAVPADFEALSKVIVAFGDMSLALAPVIEALEINPLLVSGDRIAAVDCLIVKG